MSRCLILANPKAGRLRAALARLSRIAGKPTDALSAPDSLRFLHEAAERAGLNASIRVIPPRDRLPDLVAAALRVLVPRAAPPSMSGFAVEERGAASPETAGVRSGAHGRI